MQFVNGNIYREDFSFHSGDFRVENGLFSSGRDNESFDLEGAYVIPGLVDIHTHGNSGMDFSDPDCDVGKCADYLVRRGITSFLMTVETSPRERLYKVIGASGRRLSAFTGTSHPFGFNLEGPFLSPSANGAQNADWLIPPDEKLFGDLQNKAHGHIKIVSVAPELPGAMEFIGNASQNCTVSLGHTSAGYSVASAAFDSGASHVTHLFNAMRPFHHRDGALLCAAAEKASTVELIADGIHVSPEAIRLAFSIFRHRICLVSDSLSCCGMPPGKYRFGNKTIVSDGKTARLTDGTLAGSASDLMDILKKCVSFGIPLEEAVRAATHTPASAAGAADITGSISPGKHADFLVLDNSLNLLKVFSDGIPVI